MPKIQFGWRTPDFPTDGSTASQFFAQIHTHMAVAQDHFDSAWVADHFNPWAGWEPQNLPTVECWTNICYLAAMYPRLTLGTIVLAQSYRNPALLAKMAAVLATWAPGRLVLGLGAGWKEDEYRAYGYEFPSAATRIHQLDETVQIVKAMFTQEQTTFHGQYYHVENAICEPKPNPPIPILIGGGGEKLTLRVVAKYADVYNLPNGTLDNYKHKLEVLRAHCAAVGREYNEIIKSWSCEVVAVAPTEAEAREKAGRSLFYQHGQESLIGTPQQIAAALRPWIDAGVTQFQMRFADYPHTGGMELFISDVMPLFR